MRTAEERVALGVFAATGLFLLYVIGALGIIGAGGPPDLMYVAALAVGVVGAVVVRLRPRGMAVVMALTALATVVAGLAAIAAGLYREEGASVPEILGLSAMFACPFALAAGLYRRAVRG